MANGLNQQSDGWAIPATFVLIWLCPAAAVVLALLLLSVKAPKVTGALFVASGICVLTQLLADSDAWASDPDSFLVPVGLVCLLFIAAGCALFASGLRGGTAAATALPIQPNRTPQPVCNPSSAPDDQSDEEEMYAALEEAKAIAGRMQGGQEARKRIFERVFRHRCQQRGVRVNRVVWKRSDHSSIGSETETRTEN